MPVSNPAAAAAGPCNFPPKSVQRFARTWVGKTSLPYAGLLVCLETGATADISHGGPPPLHPHALRSWCSAVTHHSQLAERVHALSLGLPGDLSFSSDAEKIARALSKCVNLKELAIHHDNSGPFGALTIRVPDEFNSGMDNHEVPFPSYEILQLILQKLLHRTILDSPVRNPCPCDTNLYQQFPGLQRPAPEPDRSRDR
ncbi:hypothetical protein B0H11DRAFT_2079004 [Mycena galericulata]|nr:hypothetical protein B0H11DRAFT_2131341 [Mycena galericulata]KAJ7449342.1 hypothetical protein B0H11DRAFT_2079004 [Mycena galericulata]